jgi:putative SOS response-associated peptidase YedK
MFRMAFKRNRCLIPASGYYEWLNTPTGKQPYYYTARDGSSRLATCALRAVHHCIKIASSTGHILYYHVTSDKS